MSLFRPDIDRIEGYVPGEQPQETGWVKLNTNENPYPPSPRVVAAIQAAAAGRLNVYPDPLARRFRQLAGELFGLDEEWVLPANGSDENLTILMRSFVDAGEQIAYPYPSYVLYETLAEIQGARVARLPLESDWSWDMQSVRSRIDASKLVFVPNPNSPSGTCWDAAVIEKLVPPRGVLVLDQAYADFAEIDDPTGILRGDLADRAVITRTLSKSYSLAGIRFGFALARPELIAGMRKVKDSYNCNTLSLAAAVAALEDQDWMLENRDRIRKTRARLAEELRGLKLSVLESHANFLWVTSSEHDHRALYESLKARKVLVRYMAFPGAGSDGNATWDGLRITIGTDAEVDRFLDQLREIVG